MHCREERITNGSSTCDKNGVERKEAFQKQAQVFMPSPGTSGDWSDEWINMQLQKERTKT
ncbi:hypothetical protein PILCRDRAFT_816145 [Piloderma croceum F 1598]|uniref:Uncharacterized protein n=1 Tax=Piloderma croceum (strain F 1598) TaxID=765440 RepID=A0A0C3BIS6_PILCF|nr:hypothetical protein PILCRDRAFT_816145 [Piloderma croceum F 1598]